MSDAPDFAPRAELARIDHAIAETRRFVVEQHKLAAERDKLAADARDRGRYYILAPWQVALMVLGGIASLVGGILSVMSP